MDGNLVVLPENGFIDDGGELMLYPSRDMRDWSKFSWKKGDVLWYAYIGFCVFEGWANGKYTEFYGRYLKVADNGNKDKRKMSTSMWSKICTKKLESEYIAEIENQYGGKLNRYTLEFEIPKSMKDVTND